MMAKPIKTLELHYPMIQFLIIGFIACRLTPKLLFKTPSRHQILSKTEMSYAQAQKYSQEYSQLKISEKEEYSASVGKTIFLYEKSVF